MRRMRRTIHVHIHHRHLTTDGRHLTTDGRWVTINGTHVYIANGEITKGPPALKEEDEHHDSGKGKGKAAGKKAKPKGGESKPKDKRESVHTKTTRPATPADMKHLYHQTSISAAMKILQSGSIKPASELSPEYAEAVYGGTDGGDYVYLGLNKGASEGVAVGEGVMLHITGMSMLDRTVVDPEMEGGIALVKGGVNRSSIRSLEFTNPKDAETPQGKALMKLFRGER